MTTEDYVSYPVALALKKHGFNWLCTSFYNNLDKELWEGGEMNWNNGVDCSAPTLWQAQKWLRDMKRLSIEPYANIAVAWNYNIADLDNFAENVGGEASFPSYESALSAGIAAAIELIEKKGE